MKNIYRLFTLSIVILTFASCEKVINVDLKNTAPTVVIEALITNDSLASSYTVLVGKSTAFSAEMAKNPVGGALVVMEDISDNIKDTLKESTITKGSYQSSKIKGIVGHVYQLHVTVDGTTYNASSQMPNAVPLDSMYLQTLPAFGNDFKQIIPVFTDPINQPNFYRFALQINDSVQRGFQAWDDALSDGKTNSRPLFIDAQDLLDGQDTVYLTVNCTDKGMYDFFYTLDNAGGSGQTPANPTSAFSNGAIGYFGAVTMQRRRLIIP